MISVEMVEIKNRKQLENEDLLSSDQDSSQPFSVASGSTNVSVDEGNRNSELRVSTPDEDPKEKAERHKKIGKIFLMLFICMFVARTD